jgi:phosphatidylglycerophosphatase A
MTPRLTQAIATFGYVGLLPGPAGTWGSAAAIPVGYALHWLGGFPLLALATVALYGVGYWATRVEILDKDDLDPGEIVVDEVVGQWIALWPLSFGLWHAGVPPHVFPWPGWVGAFLFFRLFDVTKLGPVGWADRRKGPTGVMLDDVIAGAMAAIVVAAAAAVAHGWLR